MGRMAAAKIHSDDGVEIVLWVINPGLMQRLYRYIPSESQKSFLILEKIHFQSKNYADEKLGLEISELEELIMELDLIHDAFLKKKFIPEISVEKLVYNLKMNENCLDIPNEISFFRTKLTEALEMRGRVTFFL